MARVYRDPSGEPEPEGMLDPNSLGHQGGRIYNTPAANEETGAPNPATPVVEADGTPPFNPAEHTADEVNEYLADADEAEVDRVLQAEANGKARKGILEGPHAPEQV